MTTIIIVIIAIETIIDPRMLDERKREMDGVSTVQIYLSISIVRLQYFTVKLMQTSPLK